jgi:hypothetical protein
VNPGERALCRLRNTDPDQKALKFDGLLFDSKSASTVKDRRRRPRGHRLREQKLPTIHNAGKLCGKPGRLQY